jgi:ABC-type glutathione transport system ATPase component
MNIAPNVAPTGHVHAAPATTREPARGPVRDPAIPILVRRAPPVLLAIEGLTRRFRADELPAVTDVSFTVAEGELLALLGPSGCGKTTTLRMIGGFETPDAGTDPAA